MLEKRFNKFKQEIVDIKYGKYWEEAKKSFEINFIDSKFKNLGERDYYPEIYDEQIDKKDLVKIFNNSDYFYQVLGSQKLCQKKDGKNLTLLYANSYYQRIEKYIINEQVVCEVGSGSGLLSSIIHQNKKTINILIDIPNVLLCAIAFVFTLFPEKSFLLPNEINDKEINLKNYDFVFLLPEQIFLIKDESIDFAINTQSFMEMDKQEVNNYLQFFHRTIKFEGYFFTSNRLKKRHYFFNYQFNLLKNFKKIFLEKDVFFYNYSPSLSSMINLLLIKSKLIKKKDIHFNIFSKIYGIFYFKKNEFFYWLYFYIKKIFKFYLKKNSSD
jgi:putative sugar O-methyltransferase